MHEHAARPVLKKSSPLKAACVLVVGALMALSSMPALAVASGAEVFLDSAIAVDSENGTVTLPLYKGRHDGSVVWYVVTESSNKSDAERRGVNHAEKLANALGTRAVQQAHRVNGMLNFTGTVDFSPTRVVIPGPESFPPAEFHAGAIGDADYSPLVTSDGRTVLNATQVANASGLHDAIVPNGIDYAHRRVTLDTLNGFYEGNRVQYLHQEASVELVAALEGSTWAPNLDAAPGLASFDRDASARAAIIPIINGQRGVNNPQRQGLQSAVAGEGDPLNITQVIPGDNDYTPIWDVTPAVWTQQAIDSGQQVRLMDHDDVADLFEDGVLVSGGTGPANDSLEGLRALPGISNCPVVIEFD
ncbi:hypothetical protein E3T39_08300 [Cryobacterium suzukii]|uniref:Uncharacterized protein n=1 Tax=Cryobacterium suzukii TaxID=1259198 RepID=A0A4R9AFX7_9MICO|nr:hypothetical protein [Cryobacterium suzukii]TFD60228.1 hypothetical protein E3T39_08300 [Cryobacterium suzukii]